jgi:hypothetical protein
MSSDCVGDNDVTRQASEGSERRRSSSSSSGDRGRSASSSSTGSERAPHAKNDPASASDPPLPDEDAPPLPDEAPPADDGWDAMWDATAQAYYFYNRFTQVSQWENPRIPEANTASHGSYDRFA